MNKFNKISAQLSEEDIKSVEYEIGVNFPQEFIAHYLKYNGGIPTNACFYMEEYDSIAEISCFLPIKYNDNTQSFTIEESFINYTKEKNVISPHFIPFARDWGGNLFCINQENGNIFLILLDLGEVKENNGSIRFLSDSFGTFINALENCEEDDD